MQFSLLDEMMATEPQKTLLRLWNLEVCSLSQQLQVKVKSKYMPASLRS